MALQSDSFNRGSAGPARGLGAEARVERLLELAKAVFENHAGRVREWAAADPIRWPASLPASLRVDVAWQARARVLANTHARGLDFVLAQCAALKRAREVTIPHQRQQLIFAIPADFAQASATGFLEEFQALARAGNFPSPVARAATVPSQGAAPMTRREAPAAPPTGALGLGDLVKRFAARVERREEAAAKPGGSPSEAQQLIAEVAQTVAKVRLLYDYTSERTTYIEQAVALRESPPQAGEAALPNAPPRVRDLVTQLVRLFDQAPPVYQRCQVALGQTTSVRRELLSVEQGLKRLGALAAVYQLGEVRRLDVATLRGKAVPLANFPATFKGDPILRQLFPAP